MSASINVIAGPLVDQLSDQVLRMTQELIKDLTMKWKVMYDLTEEEKYQRVEKLKEYIKGFFDEISESEDQKRIEMLNRIDSKLKEFYKLQKDLGAPDQIFKMEVKEPYHLFLKDINESMAHFVQEKEKRLSRLQKLCSEEKELCKALGSSPLEPFPNPVPSEQQLDILQHRIFELEEEKVSRLTTYKDWRAVIMNLTRILEYEPGTQFEIDIVANGERVFQPTAENMRRLKGLKSSLEKQYEVTKIRREDLLEKLSKLWDRLKVDPGDRESFLTANPTISKTHLTAIEREIDRCEKLKRENMQQVIESAREHIQALWDKLTYSQEQRQQFVPFLTDHFSEDVLDLHELEIERLELFYYNNRHIFELAEKRNELWERMLHLDNIAQDKNRLFNNRGGQLLKEERERKALEINLPKVDKHLKEALLEYGQPFFWHGDDLMHKITQDWEDRIALKESKKIARKFENQKALEKEAILGSRPAVSQQKRKAALTSGVSAKTRKCEVTDCTITLKTGVRTPLALAKTPLNTSTSSVASYSQFHEGIEKSLTRSALKEVGNTPVIAHSSPTHTTPRHGSQASSTRTPRTAPLRTTPASRKRTPQTSSRLAHCRKRLPINL